jgi:undecaprenyl-phosphate 4-deoxy-4-formamido-L-arabinose transferase
MAGFAYSRGRFIVTLDADLQNPPEEIGKLMAEFDAGHDYVGTIRVQRQDSAWRRYASQILNRVRERTTRIQMTDQGCMFRGYSRQIVDAINQCSEGHTFIPALGYMFAANPVEIEIGHEERAAGESKYSLYRLIKLNFDLMTSFSILPVQLFTVAGIGVSVLSLAFVVFLLIRRLTIGPEAEGLFTLFAIAFFLIGICLFGLGLLGEYIGRIYEEVRRRPRYLVSAVLEQPEDPR